MSLYYIPDITGQNSAYLQENVPVVAYQLGAKIIFDGFSVFEGSLVIKYTDGTGYQLVKNTDWRVQDDDVDQLAMMRAKLEDMSFNQRLIKSVTIISNAGVNRLMAATYQTFNLKSPGLVVDDGTPIEITPDYIKSLGTAINGLRQQVARVTSPVVPNLTPPKLLPFDQNGDKPGNVITGEVVTVNTAAGASVIRFSQGAFFADSVSLVYNGTTLVQGTDYIPIIASPLTNTTTNISGIYQAILINTVVTGDVTCRYHAVGGEVQPSDIDSVYQTMVGIQQYLDSAVFITPSTVADTPAMQALYSRILNLEDNMRRLLSGTPTYGDSNNGDATTRPIQAPDSNLHWYTIATLYTVTGSTDIVRADQFKGRVFLPDANIAFSFTADFNMDQTRNPFSVTTDSLVFDPKYTLFQDTDVSAPQFPMLRVVWNENAQAFSGACLQIGVALPNLLDRMVVENMSTPESCWILTRANEFITGQTTTVSSSPSDNGFTLPDGASVWSSSSSVSYKEVYVPVYEDGYLAYSGAQVSITSLVTISSTASLFSIALPTYFPVQAIRELVVTLQSTDADTVYDVVIPVTYKDTNTRMGRCNFADSELEAMVLMATVTQDGSGNISIGLNISEIANPLISNTPSSKTDLVRYIRARV